MKGKERGRGSREKMGFCEIKKEKKNKIRGSDQWWGLKVFQWWGLKVRGKEASLKLPYL